LVQRRFCWAIGVPWNQATRIEARDFSRWIQISDKTAGRPTLLQPGTVNPLTGKASPGRAYAPATVLHSETVLRGFYEFHLQAGTGPIVNPFPLVRIGRAHAHRSPMEPFRNERAGLYRPRLPRRIPRYIPDEKLNELFVALGSDRDRALVAFWISTGARASELLGVIRSGVEPGQQLVTVIRKGSRALQQLPASPDAFVWLRLYEEQIGGLVAAGPDDPVWWTLRRPYRPLAYHAARAMFVRANEALGANWSLHDLRPPTGWRGTRRCRSLTLSQASTDVSLTSITSVRTCPDDGSSVVISCLVHDVVEGGDDARASGGDPRLGDTIVDGARGRRRAGRPGRPVPGLPDRHRPVAEHGQGLRPRHERPLAVPRLPGPGLARGPAGRYRRVRRVAAAAVGGAVRGGRGAAVVGAGGQRGDRQPQACRGELVLCASGA
jgi:integrase